MQFSVQDVTGIRFLKTSVLWQKLHNIPWLPFTISIVEKHENWNVPRSYPKQSLMLASAPVSERHKLTKHFFFLRVSWVSSKQDRVLLERQQFSVWHSGLKIHLEALATNQGIGRQALSFAGSRWALFGFGGWIRQADPRTERGALMSWMNLSVPSV